MQWTRLALGINVGDICGNAGSAADVVEAERGDEGVLLKEEGEGLADTSTGTEDGDLGLAGRRGGEAAGLGEGAESGAGEHGGRRRRRGR